MVENGNVMVSICVPTFNQEAYISKALDSVLQQKMPYSYEVIVHDDASTDGTKEIIQGYEKRYPNIVKAIYQKENQYSQNKKIWNNQVFPHARGKYIAINEGDDFWMDEQKLYKQISFLEEHPNFSMSVHASKCVDKDGHILENVIRPQSKTGIRQTQEVICRQGGYFATNSMVFRSEYIRKMPDFDRLISVSDYPLSIHLALCGKCYYIDEFLSVYRVEAIGSWSSENCNNKEKSYELQFEVESMMKRVDEITSFQYHEDIKKKVMFDELELYAKFRDKKILSPKYYKYFKGRHYRAIIKMLLGVNGSLKKGRTNGK